MILRFYLIAGLLLLGGTGYFIVVQQEPDFQAAPITSEVVRLQQEGVLPSGPFEENEEIEHDVFEVPPEDEAMLEAAIENMDMGGMDMSGGESAEGTMTMADGSTMPAADMGTTTAPAMDDTEMGDMAQADDGTMPASEGDTMQMADTDTAPAMGDMAQTEDGTAAMSDDGTMPMAGMAMADCTGEGGLGFCPDDAAFDREIELSMTEWSFSDLEIEVQEGERIRFTVRNDGLVLHEFMFMTAPLMQAVTYRARRADWNLLEHEALYEKSLLLPGETLTFVAEVQSTGNWMFMCMLPYHMQMGMMGQMATPGAAMDM